jgi:serine/threonine protein kinase
MVYPHCPVSGILLFHPIRWAVSDARVVQEARIRRIGERFLTKPEESHAHVGVQACAVNHLHGLGIIHRDIKLENVMVKNDGHVVLGEFDLAVRLETADSSAPRPSGSLLGGKGNALKTRRVCGTLPYMAPEVLRNMEYSYGVDWFSYGVFLHVFYLDKV